MIKTKLRWDNVSLIKSNIVILSWNRTNFYTKSIIMKTITPKILIKIIPDGWYDDVIKIWMTYLINTHKLRDHKQICRCFEPFAVVLEGLSFWRLLTIPNHHGEQSNKHHLKLRQLLAKLLTNPCLCVPNKWAADVMSTEIRQIIGTSYSTEAEKDDENWWLMNVKIDNIVYWK